MNVKKIHSASTFRPLNSQTVSLARGSAKRTLDIMISYYNRQHGSRNYDESHLDDGSEFIVYEGSDYDNNHPTSPSKSRQQGTIGAGGSRRPPTSLVMSNSKKNKSKSSSAMRPSRFLPNRKKSLFSTTNTPTTSNRRLASDARDDDNTKYTDKDEDCFLERRYGIRLDRSSRNNNRNRGVPSRIFADDALRDDVSETTEQMNVSHAHNNADNRNEQVGAGLGCFCFDKEFNLEFVVVDEDEDEQAPAIANKKDLLLLEAPPSPPAANIAQQRPRLCFSREQCNLEFAVVDEFQEQEQEQEENDLLLLEEAPPSPLAAAPKQRPFFCCSREQCNLEVVVEDVVDDEDTPLLLLEAPPSPPPAAKNNSLLLQAAANTINGFQKDALQTSVALERDLSRLATETALQAKADFDTIQTGALKMGKAIEKEVSRIGSKVLEQDLSRRVALTSSMRTVSSLRQGGQEFDSSFQADKRLNHIALSHMIYGVEIPEEGIAGGVTLYCEQDGHEEDDLSISQGARDVAKSEELTFMSGSVKVCLTPIQEDMVQEEVVDGDRQTNTDLEAGLEPCSQVDGKVDIDNTRAVAKVDTQDSQDVDTNPQANLDRVKEKIAGTERARMEEEKRLEVEAAVATAVAAERARLQLEEEEKQRRIAKEQEEARRREVAENAKAEAEAKRISDEKAVVEAQAKRIEKAAAEAEARRIAAEMAAAAAEKKRVAAEKAAAEAQAKRIKDERAADEARAKRVADEKAAACNEEEKVAAENEAKRIADENTAADVALDVPETEADFQATVIEPKADTSGFSEGATKKNEECNKEEETTEESMDDVNSLTGNISEEEESIQVPSTISIIAAVAESYEKTAAVVTKTYGETVNEISRQATTARDATLAASLTIYNTTIGSLSQRTGVFNATETRERAQGVEISIDAEGEAKTIGTCPTDNTAANEQNNAEVATTISILTAVTRTYEKATTELTNQAANACADAHAASLKMYNTTIESLGKSSKSFKVGGKEDNEHDEGTEISLEAYVGDTRIDSSPGAKTEKTAVNASGQKSSLGRLSKHARRVLGRNRKVQATEGRAENIAESSKAGAARGNDDKKCDTEVLAKFVLPQVCVDDRDERIDADTNTDAGKMEHQATKPTCLSRDRTSLSAFGEEVGTFSLENISNRLLRDRTALSAFGEEVGLDSFDRKEIEEDDGEDAVVTFSQVNILNRLLRDRTALSAFGEEVGLDSFYDLPDAAKPEIVDDANKKSGLASF